MSVFISGCSHEESVHRMSTEDIIVPNVDAPLPVMYVSNMQSEKMFCYIIANDMRQIDNSSSDYGDAMTGANLTAFLQPGKNDLQVAVVPGGAYDGERIHRDNGKCTVSVSGAFENGVKAELTSITVTAEDGKATAKTSKSYHAKHQSPLPDFDGVVEGYATTFTRNLYIKTIPTWAWTQAKPFTETPENMKKLRNAYKDLYRMMEARDFKGLEAAWSLSNREKSIAEGHQLTPNEVFKQVGFESGFKMADDAYVMPPRAWEDYKLKLYAGGRLVRLEDKGEASPLRIGSNKINRQRSLTPYFSFINGRLVVSR